MTLNNLPDRHIGPSPQEQSKMLKALGMNSLEQLIESAIPHNIALKSPIKLPEALSESEYAAHIESLAALNRKADCYIGQGYFGAAMPPVIYRNVFENPVWYTSYTPYQAEISQGRLEALLNFQTAVSELTALPLANCSLLDESTAAAETASMFFRLRSRDQVKRNANKLWVDTDILPQTLAVLHTRMAAQGIEIVEGDFKDAAFDDTYFGAILQYPNSDGNIEDYSAFVELAHSHSCLTGVATDLLALTLLKPPGEWGADAVFGSSQRFGVPMFNGGPSAAFFATRLEYKRSVPGRIIGVSKDKNGKPALRMALQTREQHIKREHATSNICTAQALLATVAGFYAAWHGYDGLKKIALHVHQMALSAASQIEKCGYRQINQFFFDTLKIQLPDGLTAAGVAKELQKKDILVYPFSEKSEGEFIGISFDETVTSARLNRLVAALAAITDKKPEEPSAISSALPATLVRSGECMQQEVFALYRTETEMMRYIKRLERKDISLAHSMIPLGSCTMKLNPASSLLPLGLSGFQNVHPFAPEAYRTGYKALIEQLGDALCAITGFKGITFQPNSGAAGEYCGLMMIREYYRRKGETGRNTVLIPASAHGTNPASAIQAGFTTVTVACDERGNVSLDDLKAKVVEHSNHLAALMITYPSTHGIFEQEIREICEIIHQHGGQVYMDGANMNAQVGYTNPATIGADLCHLNLHKTFASPHGGGGPGAGPVCVAEHLVSCLPVHPAFEPGKDGITVAAAPYGSAGILPIAYGYIVMMGAEGLKKATAVAILNANYLAEKLKDDYGIVYTGAKGRVGHELILDCRQLKARTGISEADIAKRLMDYGYHAPTLSFPVHGTLMIEPTESESLAELDRFVAVMKQIRVEIEEVEKGIYPADDNPLVNAPHPQYEVCADQWTHPYPRGKAAFALPFLCQNKFWLDVARVDDAFGDRNLTSCICCQ